MSLEQKGTHHSKSTNSIYQPRGGGARTSPPVGWKKTNMELVHKALSMGGKCMLNNNGQSQYAQNKMQGH